MPTPQETVPVHGGIYPTPAFNRDEIKRHQSIQASCQISKTAECPGHTACFKKRNSTHYYKRHEQNPCRFCTRLAGNAALVKMQQATSKI